MKRPGKLSHELNDPLNPKPKSQPTAGTRGGQPGNTNAQTTGFYSDTFTPEELALVAAFVEDPSLDDEIWMQRVLNRRLMKHTGEKDGRPVIKIVLLVKVAEALAVGTGRVARLLRDKRALSGDAAGGLIGAVTTALNELSTEFGEKL
jgi:hypothetical protein